MMKLFIPGLVLFSGVAIAQQTPPPPPQGQGMSVEEIKEMGRTKRALQGSVTPGQPVQFVPAPPPDQVFPPPPPKQDVPWCSKTVKDGCKQRERRRK